MSGAFRLVFSVTFGCQSTRKQKQVVLMHGDITFEYFLFPFGVTC